MTRFDSLRMEDVRLAGCNLANAAWPTMSCVRAEFVTCRMTGFSTQEALFHDTVFRDCKVDLAQFYQAKMLGVRFEECPLTGADFRKADLTGWCSSTATSATPTSPGRRSRARICAAARSTACAQARRTARRDHRRSTGAGPRPRDGHHYRVIPPARPLPRGEETRRLFVLLRGQRAAITFADIGICRCGGHFEQWVTLGPRLFEHFEQLAGWLCARDAIAFVHDEEWNAGNAEHRARRSSARTASL